MIERSEQVRRFYELQHAGAQVWYPMYASGGWYVAAPTRIGTRTSLGTHLCVATVQEMYRMSNEQYAGFLMGVQLSK